jgi:NAD(P)-dependent dehydrogenase (short-subunit alcohol dehydrogenase family)
MKIDLSNRVASSPARQANWGASWCAPWRLAAPMWRFIFIATPPSPMNCARKFSPWRRAITVQADITEAESVLQMQRTVTQQLGDAAIIVNNAVVQYEWTKVLEQSVQITKASSARACCTTC